MLHSGQQNGLYSQTDDTPADLNFYWESCVRNLLHNLVLVVQPKNEHFKALRAF